MSRCWGAGLVLAMLPVITGAQERPRTAVIPLNPIGVSSSEAQGLTALLETGLVNTEVFEVVEQSQISEILEAQEHSISDCTDEGCAVEFGKLLAAEQIILGTVSRLGSTYVINAKVIDVRTGRNLKAAKVDASSLEELTREVDLLAYKLAGLTFRTGEKEEIARSFGELFVQTEPADAEIIVNGVRKGTSPLLVQRVPVGIVGVEARKGNMYGSQEVAVKGEVLAEATLVLEVSLGRVFVRSSEKEVRVFLDTTELGGLGAGLFKDIPAGEHELELVGAGLYWRQEVTVVSGETTTVEAYPREVGSIRYHIPEGAKAEIAGREYRQVVHGSGTLERVYAGSYGAVVSGPDYVTAEVPIEVERSGEIGRASCRERVFLLV